MSIETCKTIEKIRIIIGDNGSPYKYSNDFINDIYEENNSNYYKTLSEMFLIMSGNSDAISSYKIGNESYNFSKSQQEIYYERYKFYLTKYNGDMASMFTGNANNESQEDTKYNILMGGKYNAE